MSGKPANTGKNRDGTGKFLPGESGNPNGRPKGAGISITTEIKRKLEEMPEGEESTNLQLLIDKILKQAIQDGDQTMITKIWNYVDGMPLQKSESKIEGELTIKQVTYKSKKKK